MSSYLVIRFCKRTWRFNFAHSLNADSGLALSSVNLRHKCNAAGSFGNVKSMNDKVRLDKLRPMLASEATLLHVIQACVSLGGFRRDGRHQCPRLEGELCREKEWDASHLQTTLAPKRLPQPGSGSPQQLTAALLIC